MSELFAAPLWAYAGVLAAAGLALLWPLAEKRRRKALSLFADPDLIGPLLAGPTREGRRRSALLRAGAVFFLFLALSGPRGGLETVGGEEYGVHAVLAVDVSASMLSEDVKPSRLEKAKRALSSLLDQMQGNRVGIVAFSGVAAVQCPLTTDLNAARLFLQALRPDMLPVKGTAVGEAVRLGARMLGPYPGTKGIVLITDGEDHGSDPPGAAQEAAAAGVRIFALGIGNPDGEPIPVRGPDGKVAGYKRDEKGQIVLSRLDERTLSELARLTGGAYYRSTQSEAEIGDIAERLRGLDKSRLASGVRERLRDRTQFPLAIALLLLLLELYPLPAKRGEVARRAGEGMERVRVPLTVLVVLLASVPARAAEVERRLRQGNKLLDQERYDEALESYQQAQAAAPADPRPAYNQGVAQYRMGQFDAAAEAFDQAGQAAPSPLKRDALFNEGNSRFRAQKNDDAVSRYRALLLLDPGDQDARHNLQIALKRRQQQKQEKQERKEKKDQKEQQKQDQAKPKPPQGGQNLSKEDARRILEAMREKEKQNFNPDQYDRAGKLAKPGKAAGAEDW